MYIPLFVAGLRSKNGFPDGERSSRRVDVRAPNPSSKGELCSGLALEISKNWRSSWDGLSEEERRIKGTFRD